MNYLSKLWESSASPTGDDQELIDIKNALTNISLTVAGFQETVFLPRSAKKGYFYYPRTIFGIVPESPNRIRIDRWAIGLPSNNPSAGYEAGEVSSGDQLLDVGPFWEGTINTMKVHEDGTISFPDLMEY